MHIPKGIIEKWNNKTSARLLDKVFGPATEADIIEWIGTLYEQGILGGGGKIRHEFSEHSQHGTTTQEIVTRHH